MPITYVGPRCARRGCKRPAYRGALCGQCWRLAVMFCKDPEMFCFEPLDGYRGHRDAVELPWQTWEQEARAEGRSVVDLFARPPSEGGAPDCR